MSGSLFDSEANRSSNWKIYLIGCIALIVVCAAVYTAYLYSVPVEKTRAERIAEEIRDTTVPMMAQPLFAGADFAPQILGKGRLQRYDWRSKEVYFSFPQAEPQEFDEFLGRFFADRQKVEIGREKAGKIALGDYILTVSPENFYFFRTALANIRIDPNQTLNFPFRTVNYSLSLEELKNYVRNAPVYGGKLLAEDTQQPRSEQKIVFANHGMMVAKPNEPSLQRLVNELLKDESIRGDREKRIQRLVDFVSNEIEYSYTEAVASRETLKRANEVLMTRSADCSNKTILLASLLEQIGEDYILLYCPQHITVAVPQGNYANENKLEFDYENKKYVIAETTVPGFQIGKTRVNELDRLINVNYVQVPKQIDLIFDAKSYVYLNFL
jgi:hypothetical protein